MRQDNISTKHGKDIVIPPLKFRPILKNVLWGGSRIAQFKGIESESTNIGESWEISGVRGKETPVFGGEYDGYILSQLIDIFGAKLVGEANFRHFGTLFPLLIKFIHAEKPLSLQVHPNDEFALRQHGDLGKTEMWYIIDAKPDSFILSGLTKRLTPEEYVRRVQNDTIMDIVSQHKSHTGDIFFIPSGRIHSIGAGNFILEVQQTSDITYRIYDFNRKDADGNLRELHTDLAKQVIDYNVYDHYVTNVGHNMKGLTNLLRCNYFDVKRLIIDQNTYTLNINDKDSFMIIVCIDGNADIVDSNGYRVSLEQGETVLIPAATKNCRLTGSATLITTTTL